AGILRFHIESTQLGGSPHIAGSSTQVLVRSLSFLPILAGSHLQLALEQFAEAGDRSESGSMGDVFDGGACLSQEPLSTFHTTIQKFRQDRMSHLVLKTSFERPSGD